MFAPKTAWWAFLSFCLIVWPDSRACAQLQSIRVGSLGPSTFPTSATYAPGDATGLYVATRYGHIWRLDLNTGLFGSTPFFNLANTVGPELLTAGGNQGLLGFTFHPDFAINGYFFVNYTSNIGNMNDYNGYTRVERYTFNHTLGSVVPGSRVVILQERMHSAFHNGGWMAFSPRDRFLYVATGDGQIGVDPLNLAQDKFSLRGKILRINPNEDDFPADPLRNYGIPADNPFANQPSQASPEIWALGLRNPWQNSFDRATGDLWIADVGESHREEVNFQPADWHGGANYGWKYREGTIPTPGHGGPAPPDHVEPIYEYDHSVGQSITGGFVYRGPTIIDNGQSLEGNYFFGDFMAGRIWTLRFDGTTLVELVDRTDELHFSVNGGFIHYISGFAEDLAGNLYVLNYVSGDVFRIQSAAIPEPSCFILAGLGSAMVLVGCRRLRHVRHSYDAAGAAYRECRRGKRNE